MPTHFTISDLERLQASGKIAGFSKAPIKKMGKAFKIIGKAFRKRSNEKEFIEQNLWYWCSERGMNVLQEYRFDGNGRKWRFDWFVPKLKLGIEYNGIFSKKSRHTTVTGYTGDMNKLNAAQAQGFRVLQFTPLNYKSLITELNKLI